MKPQQLRQFLSFGRRLAGVTPAAGRAVNLPGPSLGRVRLRRPDAASIRLTEAI